MDNLPKSAPIKHKKSKPKHCDDNDNDEDEDEEPRLKPRFKKKKKIFGKDKTKGKNKKKFARKAYIVGEWSSDDDSSDSSSSNDEEVASLAITNSTKSLTSPSMCYMARSFVEESDEESSDNNDDEPSYDELVDMIKKAHKIIIKQTKNVEVVSKEHEVAVFCVGELQDELKELRASQHARFDKLKGDYIEKHKNLELVLKAIDMDKALPLLEPLKIAASTSCDESTISCTSSTLDANLLTEYNEIKEREAMMDGFERLNHGRTIHKEILSRNLVNNVS